MSSRSKDEAIEHIRGITAARVDDVIGNARTTQNIAAWLSLPDCHLTVLFERLLPYQRRAVVTEAHRVYRQANASDSTKAQFCAFALFIRGFHSSRYSHICAIRNPNDAEAIKIEYATPEELSALHETIEGKSARGCSLVFFVARDAILRGSEVGVLDLNAIVKLRESAKTPAEAASLLSVSSTLQCLNSILDARAADIADEGRELLHSRAIRRQQVHNLNLALGELNQAVSRTRPSREKIMSLQQKLLRPDELAGRFKLDNSTGLYLPEPQRIILARSLDQELQDVVRSQGTLMQMSPRRFEEFARDLFVRLGYEVELTQQSRDGGADLLCLRSLHGIPVRLAVELKRYKETRPITVSLVRSFVGANMQNKANKLVYITTSYYTQPAISYATNFAEHLLTLKRYEHLREWCQEALRTNSSSGVAGFA